tara:strand:- start:25 stop:606 length:582 start_codon:yes stop_codon:yes gene_type:complete
MLERRNRSVPTPKYYIEKKGQFEFVDEAYMRKILNDLYPDWTWTVISYDLVKDEQSQKYCAVSVHGRLTVTDMNGKVRHYDSIAAHQVATLRDSGAYSDIGNDMKAANTDAFKVAINRLCNVADDVYRKSVLNIEELDTLEGLLLQTPTGIQRKVIKGIVDKEINPITFEATVLKLDSIISEQSKQTKGEKNG